jgi:hypothetical protein
MRFLAQAFLIILMLVLALFAVHTMLVSKTNFEQREYRLSTIDNINRQIMRRHCKLKWPRGGDNLRHCLERYD